MILCLKCNRIWGKDTVFCGSCGGTLGCKLCPDGHTTASSCKFCLTCGSSKLTNSVQCLPLRFISWLAIVALVVVGVLAMHATLQLPNLHFEALKLLLLKCAMLSGVTYCAIYFVLGKKSARMVFRCCQMSAALGLKVMFGLLRFLLNLSRPKGAIT